MDITNLSSHQSATLEHVTCNQGCSCNCVKMCNSLGGWQKLILLVGAMHASSPACFLLGSVPALLCYIQCFAQGALMHLWGGVGRTVLPLAHAALGFTVFQFLESWVYAFLEYVVNCQQPGELWGFFCFVLFYLLEAIVSEWELLDDRLCSFVCCLLCYSGLLSKIQSRCSGISKNPFAVACIVFCCHLFTFLSNLILKWDLPQ